MLRPSSDLAGFPYQVRRFQQFAVLLDNLTFLQQNELCFTAGRLKSAPDNRSMNQLNFMVRTPNRRVAVIALGVIALDQLTKQLVLHSLGYAQEKIVVEG